jgi:hypothetical protein
VLIVVFMMTRPWGSRAEGTKSPPAIEVAPARETSAAPPIPPTAEPIAREQPAAKPQATRNEADAVGTRAHPLTTSAAMPTVVAAQLCTALREWRCEAADNEIPPGRIVFYTQVKSATATTIEHRWYQGDRLRQALQLPIQANPGAGYRTYSRFTISTEAVGEWRVELRSADGTLLQEMRFTVR